MYNVVIVDDEPIIRYGIRASVDWTKLGLSVSGEYANGSEALAALRSENADILITDIKMPLLDGLALTRQALQLNPELKVILVSSYSDFEYVREGLKLGVVDYILKPTLESEELAELLTRCIDDIEAESRRSQAISPPFEDETDAQPMKKAIDYIYQHYDRELTLQQVADHVHISKNYFCYLFKKQTGQNFIDFVIQLRIQRAKELLSASDARVYEAAERAGFNDVKYFSKLFKKITGLTPNEYRSQAAERRRQM